MFVFSQTIRCPWRRDDPSRGWRAAHFERSTPDRPAPSRAALRSGFTLLELLAVARRNNPRAGVTGQLLYKDGNFMQLIEGDEAAVRALFARIERDPRHGGVIVLLDHVVPEREFSD